MTGNPRVTQTGNNNTQIIIPKGQVVELQKVFGTFGKAWKLKAVRVVDKPKEDEAE